MGTLSTLSGKHFSDNQLFTELNKQIELPYSFWHGYYRYCFELTSKIFWRVSRQVIVDYYWLNTKEQVEQLGEYKTCIRLSIIMIWFPSEFYVKGIMCSAWSISLSPPVTHIDDNSFVLLKLSMTSIFTAVRLVTGPII